MTLDRRAIAVSDLVEAEDLYAGALDEIFGAYLANRYLLSTYEQVQARKAAAVARRKGATDDAQEMMLPYSRVILGAARQAHLYLHLSGRHWQEPPPDQLRGTPRLGLVVTPEQMDRAPDVLDRHRIRLEGPIAFPRPSPIRKALYFRDRSGNFIELACPASDASGRRGGEIHHLILPVADLDRSRQFYEATLGLNFAGRDLFPGEVSHVCFALQGDQYLVLAQDDGLAAPAPLVCAFFSLTTEQWPELVERLERDGCGLAADPRGGLRGAGELRLRIRDPDGHALEFHTFEDQFYAVPAAGRGKVAAGRIDEFPIGSVTRVPQGKFYLVHLEGGFLAVSEICTHRQFTVAYHPEHYSFACPLHGNRYSCTGRLIHRGAREDTPPLHVYRIEFADGVVIVDTDESVPRSEEDPDWLVQP